MKKYSIYLMIFIFLPAMLLFGKNTDYSEVFELFYNYRFKETKDYLLHKIETLEDPYSSIAFFSYAKIRSDLINARYDNIMTEADSVIQQFRSVYEKYLELHPEDVYVQFYYTVLLAGKTRIYLNKMDYFQILKDGPKILAKKMAIDRYATEPFYDMHFGTGSFNYYLSVIGRNIGFENLVSDSQKDGIDDLILAYRHGKFTKWEASIALMYVYLYDKMDFEACDKLCKDFLSRYPDNLEVRAIAAECAFYQGRYLDGDRHIRHINKLLDEGIIENDIGMRARVVYLKGIRAMLRRENMNAINYFNQAHEMDNIEYSWYKAIILKYIGDVYLDMGLKRTAILYYEETVNSSEIIPHVREAKDLLKKLK